MNWIQIFFKRFMQRESKIISFDMDFTPEQKKEIIDCAVTSASQVLLSAAVMTNSHNFITGDVVLPDGSMWRLKFERINKDTPPQQ